MATTFKPMQLWLDWILNQNKKCASLWCQVDAFDFAAFGGLCPQAIKIRQYHQYRTAVKCSRNCSPDAMQSFILDTYNAPLHCWLSLGNSEVWLPKLCSSMRSLSATWQTRLDLIRLDIEPNLSLGMIHKSQLFWCSPGVQGFWPIPSLVFDAFWWFLLLRSKTLCSKAVRPLVAASEVLEKPRERATAREDALGWCKV